MEFDFLFFFYLVGTSILNSGSSTPFIVFSVINAMIVSILVLIPRPSSAEVDGFLNFLLSLFERGRDTQDDSLEYDDSDDTYCNSHFQIKDHDADEVTTQDKQESDEHLKIRIESFIAKVKKGRIEDSSRDNYDLYRK